MQSTHHKLELFGQGKAIALITLKSQFALLHHLAYINTKTTVLAPVSSSPTVACPARHSPRLSQRPLAARASSDSTAPPPPQSVPVPSVERHSSGAPRWESLSHTVAPNSLVRTKVAVSTEVLKYTGTKVLKYMDRRVLDQWTSDGCSDCVEKIPSEVSVIFQLEQRVQGDLTRVWQVSTVRRQVSSARYKTVTLFSGTSTTPEKPPVEFDLEEDDYLWQDLPLRLCEPEQGHFLWPPGHEWQHHHWRQVRDGNNLTGLVKAHHLSYY